MINLISDTIAPQSRTARFEQQGLPKILDIDTPSKKIILKFRWWKTGRSLSCCALCLNASDTLDTAISYESIEMYQCITIEWDMSWSHLFKGLSFWSYNHVILYALSTPFDRVIEQVIASYMQDWREYLRGDSIGQILQSYFVNPVIIWLTFIFPITILDREY